MMNDQPAGCPPELREALNSPVPSVRTPFTVDGQIDFSGLRARSVEHSVSERGEREKRFEGGVQKCLFNKIPEQGLEHSQALAGTG